MIRCTKVRLMTSCNLFHALILNRIYEIMWHFMQHLRAFLSNILKFEASHSHDSFTNSLNNTVLVERLSIYRLDYTSRT
jgi:hypothetical protein